MGKIYGKVESAEDIRRINCIIRDEMLAVEDAAQLTDLKKRSDYLCTLTFSPFWEKKFGSQIDELREAALEENRATVKTANIIAKSKGFDKQYEPWKKEINIEEELKNVPEQVAEELTESLFSLKRSPEILEDLRKSFCEIRKALVLCEDVECLDKLKTSIDLLSALPYLESFKEHFDDATLKLIDELINVEKSRSVALANMIADVNNWDRLYEEKCEAEFENAEEFVEKILEEEQKAQTYIPTEAKYKGGAKVLWLVYYHPKRKREFAKRIYFPEGAFDIQAEGPGMFKNKFGNEVYGIKITYKMKIDPTTIHVRGKEIHLPERVVTKSKVVTLPEIAQNIRLTQERPKSAMDIA